MRFLFSVVLLLVFACALPAQAPAATAAPAASGDKLAVLWSSADPDVAHNVCLLYTHNAKKRKWFDEVVLIVWGPSAGLLAKDAALQAEVKSMIADGIKVEACLACADRYKATEELRKMGVDVKYMGVPLTEMLKGGWKVLTF
jgi:hypothetical protein